MGTKIYCVNELQGKIIGSKAVGENRERNLNTGEQ